MPDRQKRLTLGPIQNPVRGLLHGSAALACLALAWHLSRTSCDPATRRLLVLFALSQFALYTASALYHSVPWTPRAKRRMQRLDHSMIYVKIAGSLTPILWVSLEGPERQLLVAAIWIVAVLGIGQKIFLPWIHERASIPVQIFQASLVLPAVGPFAERFPGTPVLLALAGATIYVAGVVVFLTERPRLWPRVFSFHEVFHMLLLAGTGTQTTLALQYLAR